jgi:hypothetical protein
MGTENGELQTEGLLCAPLSGARTAALDLEFTIHYLLFTIHNLCRSEAG